MCTAEPCPVDGKCTQKGTIYQATVTHIDPESNKQAENTYIGMSGSKFIERYRNHKSAFNRKETDTELSKHIFKLRREKCKFEVKFKIIDRAPKFTPPAKSCRLCTLERYYLIFRKDLHTLNKNLEFADECAHKRFTKLAFVK